MPEENRDISFFNRYIFSYTYSSCHFKVGSVLTFKENSSSPIGYACEALYIIYVSLHTLTILMLFHSEIKGCAGTKSFLIANLKRI